MNILIAVNFNKNIIQKFKKNCKITVLENEKQRKQKGETNKIEF